MSDILDFRRKKKEFFKRWDLDDETNSYEELVKFGNRLFGLQEFRHYDLRGAENDFYLVTGISKNHQNVITFLNQQFSQCVENNKIDEVKLKHWFWFLEVFLTTIRKNLQTKISRAIDISDINLSIQITDDEVILFPRGEEELDKKLVDEVLSFLDSKSQKHFIDALKLYQKQDWIKSCESIRRAIEEFLPQ